MTIHVEKPLYTQYLSALIYRPVIAFVLKNVMLTFTIPYGLYVLRVRYMEHCGIFLSSF